MLYTDASALVKRYVREAGSQTVRRLLTGDVPVTSRLSEVEIASALHRRVREGTISEGERDRALGALAADMASIYVVELLPAVTAIALTLLKRYSLRAGDAVQLASCLHVREQVGVAVTFLVYDTRLGEAARREGFPVVPRA